jgi:DNA polymerase III epsilon subunit-like protein
MTFICGIDLETTGLDKNKDEITEIGYVIKKVGEFKPYCQRSDFIYHGHKLEITDENKAITGIDNHHLTNGISLEKWYSQFLNDVSHWDVEYLVAHNGNNFDKPFLIHRMKNWGLECGYLKDANWIDTRTDLSHDFGSNKLSYLACELGFINPFPHDALSDVSTMLKILAHFDFEEVSARSKEADVYIRAHAEYSQRDWAKKLGFRWQEVNYIHFPKMWVKCVKESQVEKLRKDCIYKFKTSILDVKRDGQKKS